MSHRKAPDDVNLTTNKGPVDEETVNKSCLAQRDADKTKKVILHQVQHDFLVEVQFGLMATFQPAQVDDSNCALASQRFVS